MRACMRADVLRTTQISVEKKNRQVQTQTEDVATLHMRVDGLHVDMDKYKERRKKNLHVRPEFVACGWACVGVCGRVGLQLWRQMTVKQNKRKRK